VQRGANDGWPVISYGRHYSGQRIGEGVEKPGMEQPRMYWDPSMAPSGMTFYTGNLWPRWQGQALVGSLKFDYIARIGGDTLAEVEQIKGRETDRVRDIRQAPDGSIWFISEGRGTIYRITP
jgi:glucose/arabinose dehydrogenase